MALLPAGVSAGVCDGDAPAQSPAPAAHAPAEEQQSPAVIIVQDADADDLPGLLDNTPEPAAPQQMSTQTPPPAPPPALMAAAGGAPAGAARKQLAHLAPPFHPAGLPPPEDIFPSAEGAAAAHPQTQQQMHQQMQAAFMQQQQGLMMHAQGRGMCGEWPAPGMTCALNGMPARPHPSVLNGMMLPDGVPPLSGMPHPLCHPGMMHGAETGLPTAQLRRRVVVQQVVQPAMHHQPVIMGQQCVGQPHMGHGMMGGQPQHLLAAAAAAAQGGVPLCAARTLTTSPLTLSTPAASPLSVSPQLGPLSAPSCALSGRSASPHDAFSLGPSALGSAPSTPTMMGPLVTRPAAPAARGGELPRESAVCRCADGERGCIALPYAPARGANARVSWRNKIWSNNQLLKRRFGSDLRCFFRENYADRSAASEPLLHNNYPQGSRIFFQGRLAPAHCVCHHLVQIFEPFAVSADGTPDPFGLQAVWIAPSATAGRVYGYVKYADSGYAAAAVAALRASVQRRPRARGQHGAAPLPPRVGTLLTDVCRRLSLLPAEVGFDAPCGGEGALFRAIHALSGRLHTLPPAMLRDLNTTADHIRAAYEVAEVAAMARYGEGIVTCAAVDACEAGAVCGNGSVPPAREPAVLDDVSLANDQRPGHQSHRAASGSGGATSSNGLSSSGSSFGGNSRGPSPCPPAVCAP